MTDEMETKTLLITVVKDGNRILMRKKPAGSPPYGETWYLLGCEVKPKQENSLTITNYLKEIVGIDISSVIPIGEDSEIKKDIDGITKKFIYKDFECLYQGGAPKIPQGAERIEWIPISKLSEYDVVPPSLELFKKIHIL